MKHQRSLLRPASPPSTATLGPLSWVTALLSRARALDVSSRGATTEAHDSWAANLQHAFPHVYPHGETKDMYVRSGQVVTADTRNGAQSCSGMPASTQISPGSAARLPLALTPPISCNKHAGERFFSRAYADISHRRTGMLSPRLA